MASILLFISDLERAQNWESALSKKHSVSSIEGIPPSETNGILVIDTYNLEKNSDLLTQFGLFNFRTLIVGQQWSEDNQVNALISGAAGYCSLDESSNLILQAIKSIEKGDIWVQRHLIQRVIGSLIRLNTQKQKQDSNNAILAHEKLNLLSVRELDVARMVGIGENNKVIARNMDISERTVKAHLTSAFKKLEISDRVHLALLMKEIDV